MTPRPHLVPHPQLPQRHSVAQYQALQGTTFTLSALDVKQPAVSFTLRLDAVRDLGERPSSAGTLSCCALLFSQCDGPGAAYAPECAPRYAPQGTYRLSHPQLGEQELFVVPMGPTPGSRMSYEIIFN